MGLAAPTAPMAGQIAHQAGVAPARRMMFHAHAARTADTALADVAVEALRSLYKIAPKRAESDRTQCGNDVRLGQVPGLSLTYRCEFSCCDILVAGDEPLPDRVAEGPRAYCRFTAIGQCDQPHASGLGFIAVLTGLGEVELPAGREIDAVVDTDLEGIPAGADTPPRT